MCTETQLQLLKLANLSWVVSSILVLTFLYIYRSDPYLQRRESFPIVRTPVTVLSTKQESESCCDILDEGQSFAFPSVADTQKNVIRIFRLAVEVRMVRNRFRKSSTLIVS